MIKRRDNNFNVWDYTDIDLLNNIRWYLEMDSKRKTKSILEQIRELFGEKLKDNVNIDEEKRKQLIEFSCLNILVHYLASPTIKSYNEVSSSEEIENNVKESIEFKFVSEEQREQMKCVWINCLSALNQILFLQQDEERALIFEKTKNVRKNH